MELSLGGLFAPTTMEQDSTIHQRMSRRLSQPSLDEDTTWAQRVRKRGDEERQGCAGGNHTPRTLNLFPTHPSPPPGPSRDQILPSTHSSISPFPSSSLHHSHTFPCPPKPSLHSPYSQSFPQLSSLHHTSNEGAQLSMGPIPSARARPSPHRPSPERLSDPGQIIPEEEAPAWQGQCMQRAYSEAHAKSHAQPQAWAKVEDLRHETPVLSLTQQHTWRPAVGGRQQPRPAEPHSLSEHPLALNLRHNERWEQPWQGASPLPLPWQGASRSHSPGSGEGIRHPSMRLGTTAAHVHEGHASEIVPSQTRDVALTAPHAAPHVGQRWQNGRQGAVSGRGRGEAARAELPAPQPAANRRCLQPGLYVQPESVDPELWTLCAGSLLHVAAPGSLVVYFPQGHAEQEMQSMEGSQDLARAVPHPAQVLCRVHEVTLVANAVTGELSLKYNLVPASTQSDDAELQQTWRSAVGDMSMGGATEASRCWARRQWGSDKAVWKVLSKSDTSGQGGLSIPRKAADNCLPALDMAQELPSQTVVTGDLFGQKWEFRHVFRGKPKRHLLTTNWTNFLTQKELQQDDKVVFMRGHGGTCKLGFRRSTTGQGQGRGTGPRQGERVFRDAAVCASQGRSFEVQLQLRTSGWAPFVVPLDQFCQSLKQAMKAQLGVKFKMAFETPDMAVRRCKGVLAADCYQGIPTGHTLSIHTLPPLWRSLKVKWDDSDPSISKPSSVSPWEATLLVASEANTMEAGSPPAEDISLSAWDAQFASGKIKTRAERGSSGNSNDSSSPRRHKQRKISPNHAT